MSDHCTVIRGEDEDGNEVFSITGPDGEEGDCFEYGDFATCETKRYGLVYCRMESPDDTPMVYRVAKAEEVPSEIEDAELEYESGDEEEGESADDGIVDVET